MSALTNDPFTLARYAGYYKAIQSVVSEYRSATLFVIYSFIRVQQGALAWTR